MTLGNLSKHRTTVLPGMKPARTRKRFSMALLAEKSGVSEATLWRAERGDGVPTCDTLKLLAVALNVSADELLGIGWRR